MKSATAIVAALIGAAIGFVVGYAVFSLGHPHVGIIEWTEPGWTYSKDWIVWTVSGAAIGAGLAYVLLRSKKSNYS